jgi:hypothetical protein
MSFPRRRESRSLEPVVTPHFVTGSNHPEAKPKKPFWTFKIRSFGFVSDLLTSGLRRVVLSISNLTLII